jgi:large subunit ribosomal protein L21
MSYAIVKTGGKQYRVSPGDVIDLERTPGEEGAVIELKEVLLVSQNEKITLGSPTVPDAKVVGEVQQHGRGKKLVVFKFKAKNRQRTKNGHRQNFTRVQVQDIVIGGVALDKGEKPLAKSKPTIATATQETSKAVTTKKATAKTKKMAEPKSLSPKRPRATKKETEDGA